MKQQATIIVDFDHTLFDAEAFLTAVQTVAQTHGIPKAAFQRTFALVTNGRGDAPYDFAEHVATLHSTYSFNERILLRDMSACVKKSRSYLYSDTLRFLNNVRRWNTYLHLVTYSKLYIREQQIQYSGIRRLLDDVHIISTQRADKIAAINHICRNSYWSTTIDDHPAILKDLEGVSHLPIRLRRKIYRRFINVEPPLYGIPVFRNLQEVYAFLEPILKTFGRRA